MRAPLLCSVFAFAAGLLVAGCVVSNVMKADETGIWVEEPLIGPGDPEAIAREHCARFAKTAEFDHEITVADGEFRAIHIYLCR